MLQTAYEHQLWRHLDIAGEKLWVTCVAGVKWQAWWMTHFFHLFSFFRLLRQQSGMDIESICARAESGEWLFFSSLHLNPSFVFHLWGNTEGLARHFPSTLWRIFNEMRWHGDAGWLTAGCRNEWQFWAGLVTHPGSDPTSQTCRKSSHAFKTSYL